MSPRQLPSKALQLPSEAINLVHDLVPAVRQFLAKGLSEDFQKSCVRIGAFDKYSGGLKAALVGGLRIDVHAVLKVGTSELNQHILLMDHINRLRPNTFPQILHRQKLGNDRVFIITEQLRKYVTLFDKVYNEATTLKEFQAITTHVFDALRVIHRVERQAKHKLSVLPNTPDPFSNRLRLKFETIIAVDPELAVILQHPGEVLGQRCSPLCELLQKVDDLCATVAHSVPSRLVHGDPHLGNIMVRRNGKFGYRVRLIDPNPEVGFSQPLYDVGKLLHWAEPVGSVRRKNAACSTSFRRLGKKQWSLSSQGPSMSAAAASRRSWMEDAIRDFAAEYRVQYGTHFEKMLSIATASAHVGLAALLSKPNEMHLRRFVIARTLSHLSILSD